MRPVYLAFEGINSFSERAEIDFSHLLEFGIFGIFGDTGSGKSTILDCIGFALYGNVTRLRSGSIADIINYRCDRAQVVFEFEIVYEGRRRTFRIERELKRKNAAQSVKVFERRREALAALSEGVRESNALLERIVGLEQKDFEKCIALPQGEFAQFVRAPRGDRLKLVARLFDLESYGEALVKRAGAHLQAAREGLNILSARLEQYDGITVQANEALRAEIARRSEEDAAMQRELSALKQREQALDERVRLRREYEKAFAEMQKLEERRAEMRTLRDDLDRLERAAAVAKAADEEARAREGAERALRAVQAARAGRARAEEEGRAAAAWDEERAQEAYVALSDRLAAAKQAKAAVDERAALEKQLAQLQKEQSVERAAFGNFSYEAERVALEERLAAVNDGDFVAFLQKNAGAALFREAYGAFAGELRQLTQRHPAIRPDSAPLIQKYSDLAQGERADAAELRKTYEARMREREALQKKRIALEQANGKYKVHLSRLQQLEAERGKIKQRMEALPSAAALGADETPERLAAALAAAQEEGKRRRAARSAAEKTLNEAQTACVRAEEQEISLRTQWEGAKKRLDDALEAGDFADAETARALARRYGDPAAVRERVERYKEAYVAARVRLRELEAFGREEASDDALTAVRAQIAGINERIRACAEALAVSRSALQRAEEGLAIKTGLLKERARAEREEALFERLKKLLDGNKFMEFVAEEYLQTVAQNAGGRLLSLTDGRYFLRYDGGFFVGDNFNGGNLRAVYTLSGGETFLVSLSLALALSAEICARSLRPIEFFFLDEGFGTLDERLVDTVMDSLERLKGEHFSIGIISHVEELKHRIERKLLVTKATERHGSQIQAE